MGRSNSEVGGIWLTSVIGVGTQGKGPRVRRANIEGLIGVVEVAREGVFLVA